MPLVVCVDVEPDERAVDPSSPSWSGFELLLERVGELRDRIAAIAEGPTVISWFVRADPQIAEVHGDPGWAFEHYADELERLRAAGDEIGIHAHAWRREDDGDWIVDHADAAWVEHCFATALEAYRQAFGEPPASARGGDRFTNEHAIELLDRSGVTADVTVEPRTGPALGVAPGERVTGTLPDYADAPEVVYRPAVGDFLRPAEGDGRRLTMIPLTAGGPEALYPWMDRYVFSARLNERLAEGAGTHLAFAVRSDVTLVDVHWERTLDNLAIVPHVAGVLCYRRSRTMTAAELAGPRR
ncbi:MAG: hypothetical protein ACHQJ5_08655 [Vicinamibacteria bacterium]